MVASVAHRYLIQQFEQPGSFVCFTVGCFFIGLIVDRVCNPFIARLPSSMRTVAHYSKIPIAFCVIYHCQPYSDLLMLVVTVAFSAIAIYQIFAEKKVDQKQIPFPSIVDRIEPDPSFVIPEAVKKYLEPLKNAKPGQATV